MKHSMTLSVLTLCVPIMAQQQQKPLLRVALTSGSTSQTGQVLEVLRSKCDGVNITIAQDKADYFLEASNIPPDVRYVLFNKEGDAVFLATPRHADNATKDVCQFLGRLK